MERLTIWNEQTEAAELLSWNEEEWKDFMGSLDVPIATEISIAINKLAEYEDAEEQGLLVRLPCKCDTVVFVAEKGFATHKAMYSSQSAMLDDIEHGTGIGYTKEEAEAELERMG